MDVECIDVKTRNCPKIQKDIKDNNIIIAKIDRKIFGKVLYKRIYYI